MKFNNRNVHVSPNARIGNNVRLGDNVVIYDNVEIGDNAVIANDCVLGEPTNAYYFDSDNNYQNPVTRIGSGALVRSHAIIYAGCTIGENFTSGHRITIREYTEIGRNCSVGTTCDIQDNVKLGDYCRLHSNVTLGSGSELEDFVFMYSYSVMTNDPFPPSEEIRSAKIGKFSQIAVHAVILPGIVIGRHCLIGANSVVSKKIPDYSMATGSPAKVERDVREFRALGIGHPYPWPRRFSRGMPWEKVGYEAWKSEYESSSD